jgi:methylmalonyl-CoA mutase cobalamin-binding domain/chain
MARLAFQRALARDNAVPGTMVYGNTVAYRGNAAENFASLAAYLAVDIVGQRLLPSGHAVNAVPVTENERIPDIDEVIEAQLFARRLIERGEGLPPLIDAAAADRVADTLLEGARRFRDRVLDGLGQEGVDTGDPAALLLALRRLGAKALEERFGPGSAAADEPRRRRPLLRATTFVELAHDAARRIGGVQPATAEALRQAAPRVLVATTDVHEHGKLLLEQVFQGLGVTVLDGGVATDPDDLADLAVFAKAEAIAISTYNGIALAYVEALQAELRTRGLTLPILVGGRLNQVPAGSNSSLPVDVTAELAAAGAVVCRAVEDALPPLLVAAARRGTS